MFLCEYVFRCENAMQRLTSTKPVSLETLAAEIQQIAHATGNLAGIRLIGETRVPLTTLAHATGKLAEALRGMEGFPHVENRNTALSFERSELPETSITPNPTPRFAPIA